MRNWAKAAMVLAMLHMGTSAMAQTVATQSGDVAGSTADGVRAFKGIPYAAPPVGDNRWRAPQPAVPWQGVADATKYGADCAQAPFPPDAAPIQTQPSEDCLFLNVWTPAGAKPGDKLPVMMWIHGGGFVNGGTSPEVYSGEHFARDGVVLVSINYRLGRYGFFAHPALADEGFGGNFGFLDQIAALKWMQSNIDAFGGDAGRVTVFGESAGGMSMHMLLQAPAARGLFHGAIIQSGGGRDRALPMPSMTDAAATGWSFAPNMTAAELRAMPEEKITGDLSMFTMGQAGYSGPMVDGKTIFGGSDKVIKAGLYANVPVIVGANSADGFPFETDKDKVFSAFGDDADAARALYDPNGDTAAVQVAAMTSADPTFIEPARLVARLMAARGQPAYLYRFSHVGDGFGQMLGGAPHASEIPYVFGTYAKRRDGIASPNDATVSAAVHGYWVNFAKTGQPDGAGMPAWPTATADDTRVMNFHSDGNRHEEDPRTTFLDFTEKRLK
jgi:para-nitrobenzyl esterase